jgi:hypothetical protein
MSSRFDEMYSQTGRPSIPPEKLLRAVAADVVFGSQRTAADGRDRLQRAIPLVRIRSEAVLVSRFKASHQPGLDEEFEYDNEQQIRM